MIGLKEYFVDGMLQIAIVLSLMRTDLDIYSLQGHMVPDMQELNLGSSFGYAQTDIHISQHEFRSYPKNLDFVRIEDILHDVHSLGNYHQVNRVATNLQAFLVNGPEPLLPLGSRARQAEVPNQVETINNGTGSSDVNESSSQDSQVTSSVGERTFSDYFGSELTKEDMDLIDVLWRQDIDLGVSRETYVASFSETHSKESKNTNSSKEEHTHEEKNHENLANLNNVNYTIDNETGEIVEWNISSAAGAQAVSRGDSLLDTLILNDTPTQENNVGRQESLDLNEIEGLLATISTTENNDGSMPLLEPAPDIEPNSIVSSQPYEIQRLDSFEQALEDAVFLMYRDHANTSTNITNLLNSDTDNNMTSLLANLSWPTSEPVPTYQNQPQQSLLTNFGTDNTSNILVQNVSLSASNDRFTDFQFLQNNASTDVVSLPPVSSELENFTLGSRLSPIFNLSLNGEVNQFSNLASHLNTSVDDMALQGAVGGVNESIWAKELASLSDKGGLTVAPYAENDSFIQQLLQDGFSDGVFSDTFTPTQQGAGDNERWSTDSAVSSMMSPGADSLVASSGYPASDHLSPVDGISEEIAMEDDSKFSKYATLQRYSESASSYTPSLYSNTSSNSSFPPRSPSVTSPKDVFHNHTYNLQPGQIRKREKGEDRDDDDLDMKRGKTEISTRSRDAKRSKELKIPFSLDEIINSPVEAFTDMLSLRSLTEAQLQLMRDIRRRGKNKEAAQSCRKRKMEVITSLENDLMDLRRKRDDLRKQKNSIYAQQLDMREKLARLQADLLHTLRDANGNPCTPNDYTLQRTADGDVILVPKDNKGGQELNSTSPNEKSGRKRKPKRKD